MRSQAVVYILISLAIAVFLWISLSFDFYQDDAYISYRYVANYLNGHGLVFNIGERVEGYTNFGWVLYLVFCGAIGLDYIVLSKLAGVFFGAAVVFIVFLVSEACLKKDDAWFSLLPVGLVAFNLSLAYWAQAGLETAAFVFLSALGLYLFLRRDRLLIAVLVLAVLIRPEGALLAGLFILIEAIVDRRRPLFSLANAGLALVLSLPLIGFKFFYYGSVLPNPFYAKTSFSPDQFLAGLDYAGRFFSQYLLYAAGLVLLPLFWRRLNRHMKTVWLFAVFYTAYVVLVGGDVLKVHRFFLPVLPAMAVALMLLLNLATVSLAPRIRYATAVAAVVGLVAVTLLVPRNFIYRYRALEEALTHKMSFLAARLKETGRPDFTVASSTIGMLGYRLVGHRVIDLLGLTDSTIARHPEPVPEDMESSWRERNFNSPYVLQSAPDYVVFSTGVKPSAPAERALMTYRQFRDCYRGAFWYYQPQGAWLENPMLPIFRRVRRPEPPFVPDYPVEFVNWYNRGLNANNAGRFEEADRCFGEARRLGGDPPYVYLLYRTALNCFQLGELDKGERLQNEILELDSTVAEAHLDLYVYEYAIGNREKAAIHRRWLSDLSPWLLRRCDSLAEVRAARWQAQQGKAGSVPSH